MYNPKDNCCTLSPDKLFGVNFNYACHLHDRQYRNEVKIRKTREQADIDFRNKIYDIFKKKNKKIRGYLVSRIYYFFVSNFAKKFWVKD